MSTPPLPEPRYEAQQWPPNWLRTVAFFCGLAGYGYEIVVDKSAHLIVLGPLFALTGLPLARGLTAFLEALRDIVRGKPKDGP